MLSSLLLALALQEPDPVRITITGRVEFDAVLRDRRLNEASYWRPGGLPSSSPLRDSDSLIAPLVRVRFDVELTPAISAVVELGNQRLNFDSFETQRQTQRLGDDDTAVDVRQAYVLLRIDAFDFTAGVVEIHRDPSGWGHPFFLSSHAESPWGELPDSTVPPFPAAGTNTVPQTRRDELQTTGVVGRFLLDDFEASLWLLPAVVEGGRASDDEALYGIDASLGFGEVRIGAIVALMVGAGHDLQVVTVGGSVRAEIGVFDGFLEGYAQFGDVGDLDAGGWAVRAGARLRFDGSTRAAGDAGGPSLTINGPWVSFEVVWVSGDKDGLDDEEGRFLSYENNDATPIVEGNEFGLDIDTNYGVVRLAGGLSVGPVDLRTAVSFFTLLEDVPLPPDPAFGVSGTSDDLGVEWDLGGRWNYSKALTLDAWLGVLFGSGVLEEFTLGRHDATFLIGFGARLQF